MTKGQFRIRKLRDRWYVHYLGRAGVAHHWTTHNTHEGALTEVRRILASLARLDRRRVEE